MSTRLFNSLVPWTLLCSVVLAQAAPTITTTSLPNGTVGVAYNATLSVSGGKSPFRWSITVGSLPSGLSLSPGGTISGMPGAAGTATFVVQVTDANNMTAVQPLTLTIAARVSVTTTTLPAGTVG